MLAQVQEYICVVKQLKITVRDTQTTELGVVFVFSRLYCCCA